MKVELFNDNFQNFKRYGFEIDRKMYAKAKEEMLSDVKVQTSLMEFAE